VGTALATGLSIAAPVIALSWATDAAVGLALRAAPGFPTGELGAPVRILGGAGCSGSRSAWSPTDCWGGFSPDGSGWRAVFGP
jgi:hypothetical protein